MRRPSIGLLLIPLFSAPCRAQAPASAGQPSLEAAFDQARAGLVDARRPPAGASARTPAATPREEFPPPDAATLKLLAKRIPGLKTESVRAVPYEAADSFVTQAAASRQSFLDVLTAPGLGTGPDRTFYVSADVLARLDQRYEFGTWPVSGKVSQPANGGSFRLEAVVVGDGWTKLLYDRGAFRYKDGENEVEVASSGTVACERKGPGAIGLKGLKGCGCIGIFCGCADLNGMRKVSDSAMKVDTSSGEQDAKLSPIRRK